MIVSLLFMGALLATCAYALARADLFTKPWLDIGVVPVSTAPRGSMGVGLGIFLVVVSGLFALLISAAVMRMGYPDWRAVDPPQAVWIGGAFLLLASVAMSVATRAVRAGDWKGTRADLALAGLATTGFLIAQTTVWWQLLGRGGGPASNPANGFFFLFTALHGLHIAGGLIALARVGLLARRGAQAAPRSIELCATYWHVLLAIWVVLVAVLFGGAQRFVELCLAAVGQG